MLFAAIALSLLLANVGAEPECLTYHALGGLYTEFEEVVRGKGVSQVVEDSQFDPKYAQPSWPA